MNITIVGGGKFGFSIAEQLSAENHDVVIIDSSPKRVDRFTNSLDVMGVVGNGVSYLVQREAGVPAADLFVAATQSDEVNLLSCLVAHKLGAKHTAARVRNPEYKEQLSFMQNDLGVSLAFNPDHEAASDIFRTLRFPAATKVETFSRSRAELVELKLAAGNPLIGKPLYLIAQKFPFQFLICAVQRGDQVFIPSGGFVLEENDRIHVTAHNAEIEQFFKALGVLKPQAKTVMIIGGGRSAYYLAKRLIAAGVSVKIIEHDLQRAEALSESLPKALVIHGDGNDQELLLEEGLELVDAFVTLTGIDEENIILGMYAHSKKVPKIITKVNQTALVPLLNDTIADGIISPKEITATQVIRYARSIDNSADNSIQTLHRMVGGKIEAIEFRVKKDSKIVDTPLKNLKLKKDLLIAGILRGSRVIIPNGNSQVSAGDRVIIISANHRFDELSDIFADD